MTPSFIRRSILALSGASLLVASSVYSQNRGAEPQVHVTSEAGGAWTGEARVKQNLRNFDTLDFEVISKQKWDRLGESHSKDVIVTWPDGHETHGIERHVEDLKAQFTFAPDTQIKAHTIRLGVGEWSSVMSTVEGTFTKPLKLSNGSIISPTNRPFRITTIVIGHWTPEGVMDHEWLMWDTGSFLKQITSGH
jgi:hypothetical protein